MEDGDRRRGGRKRARAHIKINLLFLLQAWECCTTHFRQADSRQISAGYVTSLSDVFALTPLPVVSPAFCLTSVPRDVEDKEHDDKNKVVSLGLDVARRRPHVHRHEPWDCKATSGRRRRMATAGAHGARAVTWLTVGNEGELFMRQCQLHAMTGA